MKGSVLVVGGGIGGLVLAGALRRAGFDVEVAERREESGAVGAGIVLGPNAVAVLAGLGLADAVAARGRTVRSGRLQDPAGRTLMALAIAGAEGVTRPAIAIHRAALHEVLTSGFDGPLHLGARVDGIRSDESGVTARLDGTERRFDLLVGADGIHSEVRRVVAGEVPLRYSGYTCWRAVVDASLVDEPVEVWGRGSRVGVVPLAGDRSYLYLTLNAPRRAPAPWSDLEGFRSAFAPLGDLVRRAVGAVPSLESLLHNDLEDVLAPTWWKGRVVLLGDAAHATTPNMGQGAGMAIEDAAVLARHLAGAGAWEQASRGYQDERWARVTTIRSRSWQVGKVGQLAWSPAVWLRDRVLSWTPASVGRRQIEELVAGTPPL